MTRHIDIGGLSWGALTAIIRVEDGAKRARWRFKCACGQEAIFIAAYVKEGKIKSCGCLNKNSRPRVNHGRATRGRTDPTYKSYQSAKLRCTNPSMPSYSRYGGRGIAMCERWAKDFREFLKDMGERPEGTTLDRIDADRGYEPGNCRWATAAEQVWNRAVTRKADDGRPWSVVARESGIPKSAFDMRVQRGWGVERAATEPMWNRGRRATRK